MTARLTALLIAPAAALTFGLAAAPAFADAPELASWLLYTSGLTGYGGLPANVQRVRYSMGNVYINCSDIPYYTIGPWPGAARRGAPRGHAQRAARRERLEIGALLLRAAGRRSASHAEDAGRALRPRGAASAHRTIAKRAVSVAPACVSRTQ